MLINVSSVFPGPGCLDDATVYSPRQKIFINQTDVFVQKVLSADVEAFISMIKLFYFKL